MIPVKSDTIEIHADAGLELLSRDEIQRLREHSQGGVFQLFKKCALAVLNSNEQSDDIDYLRLQLHTFEIEVIQQERGVKLRISNAPASAFVDGVMIKGLREQLFSLLRDIVYFKQQLESDAGIDFSTSAGCTNAVFRILRNARMLHAGVDPNLLVCWGGHAIPDYEYDYCKEVGYRLGLRGINIITGCGTGAMKGPMKGALVGHSKQRINDGRYIGITEPGIIAAESPNPIVNELVILPDIEKRLEAFVRFGHGVIVFPGGVGTAEEILYLLGILLHPANEDIPFPVVFTGPQAAAGYFDAIDRFVLATLGEQARARYDIIVDDVLAVAKRMQSGLREVKALRRASHDAYHFNWSLHIDWSFQQAFDPSHENMAALNLTCEQPVNELAAHLRRAFSGIVAGNVKETGIERIKRHGPYQLTGAPEIMRELDILLASFAAQKRMKLNQADYVPCYRIKE